MFKLTSVLSRWLLALAFLAGSGAAFAGPTYHVAIDSSAENGSGYLMLSFLSFDASAAVATVSNWVGFGASGAGIGNPVLDSSAGTLSLTSGADGYLFDVLFGTAFSFDVSFDVDTVPGNAANFGVALADVDGNLVSGEDLVDITLAPDAPILVAANTDYASVTVPSAAVPEPSMLLSMFTGIGLLGLTLRRRAR